jgi:histidinol-phosphate aminotransferase
VKPLVPDYIEKMQPYVPGKPIEETEREYGISNVLKLASNENPLGPSPLAVNAIERMLPSLHLYPDSSSFYLVRKLAEHLKVQPNEVFVGSGSNEIIELLIRTVMHPGDEALISQGSFQMYKVALNSHGRGYTEVPMRDGYRYDLEAMAKKLSSKTRLVFLANPDNPTSTAFSKSELEKFLGKVGPDTIVALDEAYFEYVDWAEYPNGFDYFREMSNVLVMRTFSKIYGLAGVRLGYAVMQPKLVEYLNRTKMPFNLTSVAQVAGIAALSDVEHVRSTQQATWRGLRYLETELKKLGLPVPRSHANFVFVDLGRPNGPVYEQMLKRGVIVRPVSLSGWPNAVRITAGLQGQNERCVAAR